MKKRTMLATALALAASGSQGQEITWRVDFLEISGRTHGFSWDNEPPPPFTRTTLSGLVRGEDRNGDGWIDRSELSELRFGNDGFTGNYVTCESAVNAYNYCGLLAFRFAPDGPMGPVFEMTSQWEQRADWMRDRYATVETGKEYRFEYYRDLYGSYYWTEDTTLQVTQISAVPEPGHGLMLAAGLATLFGARLRRSGLPRRA
jgi:hypothetical protein